MQLKKHVRQKGTVAYQLLSNISKEKEFYLDLPILIPLYILILSNYQIVTGMLIKSTNISIHIINYKGKQSIVCHLLLLRNMQTEATYFMHCASTKALVL